MKLEIDIQDIYNELKVIIQHNELDDEVQGVISQIKNKKEVQSIVAYDQDRMIVLKPEEIYRFYGLTGKVYGVTRQNEYTIRRKLYELEEMFENKGFVRISKASIVNLDHISSIEATFDGGLSVVMKNGDRDLISRRFVKKVKAALGIGGNA